MKGVKTPTRMLIDAGPAITFGKRRYCCQMRAHFIIGVIGRNEDVPAPLQALNYIRDWNKSTDPEQISKAQVGETVWLQLRFCPFCGREDPFYTHDFPA